MAGRIQIKTTYSTEVEPGRSIAARAAGELSPTEVVRRDLSRYYALLEHGLAAVRRIGFTAEELEGIAHALSSMALVESPHLLHLAPVTLLEAIELEHLCDQIGLNDEGCRRFREKVLALRKAGAAAHYALVDAVGRYLELPRGQRGEAGWRKVGLL